MGSDQCFHGRLKQRVQCDQTQSPRLSLLHSPHYHALPRRWKTSPPSVLIPLKTAKNLFIPSCHALFPSDAPPKIRRDHLRNVSGPAPPRHSPLKNGMRPSCSV